MAKKKRVNSRQKGKRIEREIANLLKPVFPKAARGLTQSRGAIQCDVEGTPFWIEVKGGARPDAFKALMQAWRDKNATGDRRPVLVVIRQDRSEPKFYLEHGPETCPTWGTDDCPHSLLREVSLDTLSEYA